jgi:DNA-binding beta-propeller fold protein YncE
MALSESENNLKYAEASADVANIGDFAEGSVTDFSKNNIDGLNDTLTFIVTNPTGAVQNVNLFGFTNGLFLPPAAVNPPPSILGPLLPVGVAPQFGALCTSNNTLYVTNGVSDTISIIDCNVPNGVVVATIILPLGTFPGVIAYSSVSNLIYVGGNFSLFIIDCTTNLIINTIVLANAVRGLTYNPIKNSIYFQEALGNLQEIDCITNLIVASVPPPILGLDLLAFCPIFNRMYQKSSALPSVIPFDCITNTYGGVIATGAVGTQRDILFCSFNNTIYIADGLIGNQIITLDVITNIIGASIVVPLIPEGLAYNSINNIIYQSNPALANFNEIDPVTNTIINTIALGGVGSRQIVYNSINNVAWFINAGTNDVQPYNPLVPPSAVISLQGGITMAEVFNDLQTKPMILRGLKMIVQNINQFFNNLTIRNTTITGELDSFNFQPNNYISPTNPQSLIIDATDFVMTIFYKAFILFDINPNSTVTLAFSIARSVDNTTLFTEKTDTIEDRENIRISGNPIFDMMMVELVKNGSINITEEELKYSDKFVDNLLEKASDEKNSVVQYANYPNLTGNPIADIALLNSAGFKYDY